MYSSVMACVHSLSKEIWSAWLKFGSPRLSVESENKSDQKSNKQSELENAA